MRKKNSKDLQKINGELLFTNKYLVKLMWPLFVEQLLILLNDPPKMVHRSTKLYPLPANQRALLL